MKEPYYKQIWRDERKLFLEQAHTKEEEVITDGYGNQYFYLDGFKISMPDYLVNSFRFLKYLKGDIMYPRE